MMSHRRYWIFGLIWSVCSGQAGDDDQQQMLDLRFSLRGLGLTKIDIINCQVIGLYLLEDLLLPI